MAELGWVVDADADVKEPKQHYLLENKERAICGCWLCTSSSDVGDQPRCKRCANKADYYQMLERKAEIVDEQEVSCEAILKDYYESNKGFWDKFEANLHRSVSVERAAKIREQCESHSLLELWCYINDVRSFLWGLL